MLGTMRVLLSVLVLAGLLQAVDRQAVVPTVGPKPVGPYSPGIFAGDYLYVSGQGARDPQGQLPKGIEAQTRQCLENVKAIVQAAGLTMEHVVYTQAYLADIRQADAMSSVYSQYFPRNPPARMLVGVARMPTDTPVEISAVAVRDKATRAAVDFPGATTVAMTTADRIYIAGLLGRSADRRRMPTTPLAQLQMALHHLQLVLKSANAKLDQLVSVTVYHTATVPFEVVEQEIRKAVPQAAVSVLEVASLPSEANVEVTGIAIRDRKQKRVSSSKPPVCAAAGNTVYCAVQESNAGEMDAQVRITMEKLSSALKELGADLSGAVANNVYLDKLEDFAAMNAPYGQSFPTPAPTRTTVQPAATTGGGVKVRVGVVAVK